MSESPAAEPRKPPRVKWYRTKLTREQLRDLNRKSDLLGFLQTGGYLGLLACTGAAAVYAAYHLPWYFAVALFYIHGTCYNFTINGFHELVHDSVFKTRWLNRFFLRVLSFIGWHNHHFFWASHTEHHKYTLHPPDDLEVVLPVPLSLAGFLKNAVVNPWALYDRLRGTWRTAMGHVDGEWPRRLFPESNVEGRRRYRNWARLLLVGHAAILLFCLLMGWWFVPLAFTFAPFYGGALHFLCNASQHAGLQDEVPDFRLCCRTLYLNPLFQFLYWHMNYHTEHHMYAGVPCYRLPKLHRLIKHEMPECPRGLIPTWRQIIDTYRRQKRDPDYVFIPQLPDAPQA